MQVTFILPAWAHRTQGTVSAEGSTAGPSPTWSGM